MSTRARLLVVFTLGGAIALSSTSPALAKTNFPYCIQAFFCGPVPGSERCACPTMGVAPGSLICPPMQSPPPPPPPPPCRLCHIQGTTGSGTIQTPFGVSMLAHGLSSDNGSVCTALAGLVADKVDSDGDGTPDYIELENLNDPNTAANVSWAAEPTPTYGCGVASGSRGGWWAGATLTLLTLLTVTRIRRRR